MEHLNSIFLVAKSPLEEKEIKSYLSEMGVNVELQSLVDAKLLCRKMIGDLTLYFPNTAVAQPNNEEKLIGNLKQFLQVVRGKQTTEELKSTIQALAKQRDEMVIKYWAKRKEGIEHSGEVVIDAKQSDTQESIMKLTQLVHKKIQLLHELNEVKDQTYKMYGVLAELNQCSVKDIHSRMKHEE